MFKLDVTKEIFPYSYYTKEKYEIGIGDIV